MFAGIENVHPNPRRRWTALASFTLQAAAVAAALTIPLLHPNALPEAFAHRRIFVPVSSPNVSDAVPNPHPSSGNGGLSSPVPPIVVSIGPTFHPSDPSSAETEPVGPPTLDPRAYSAYSGPPIGTVAPPVVHFATVNPPIVSRSMQGYLVRRVEPAYPSIAKIARVQGEVLIRAIISTEGRIEQAQVVNGSPLLAKAALEAIQQWRYRPYLLNDRPVEVETEITVNFVLSR